MGHILVFAFLLVFLGGVWTGLTAWQHCRTRDERPFRSLFLYVVSFDLLVFGFLAARYAQTNLIGEDPFTYQPIVWAGSAVGVFVLEVSVIWTMLRLSHDLRLKAFSGILKGVFAIPAMAIAASYIVGVTIVFRDGSPRWIIGTHQAMSVYLITGFGYALMALIVDRCAHLNETQRRSARRFGWLVLAGFLVLPTSLLLPSPTYQVGFAAGLLWLVCAPLLWLRRYSGPYLTDSAPRGASTAMSLLAKRYDLTHREQEIMALIMEGKSNKEIEDVLCVSFSTVKNHVYNMYRKLEVTSRAQMMHLVMVERERLETEG